MAWSPSHPGCGYDAETQASRAIAVEVAVRGLAARGWATADPTATSITELGLEAVVRFERCSASAGPRGERVDRYLSVFAGDDRVFAGDDRLTIGGRDEATLRLRDVGRQTLLRRLHALFAPAASPPDAMDDMRRDEPSNLVSLLYAVRPLPRPLPVVLGSTFVVAIAAFVWLTNHHSLVLPCAVPRGRSS